MLIYQIYPRSFYDSNEDGIGDLAGICAKLDYVAKLGVDAIWISPFFKSPMKDFGYDVADYREVDPIFGNMDDFKQLMEQCKQHKLGVIIDMVISHTSSEHQWFKDSLEKVNGRDDWYLWADPQPDGTPPNNWLSVFGGSAWQWHTQRRQYYFHSFYTSQPDLNMHSPSLQDAILAEMEFWLQLGVTGFRFDACNHIFQDIHLRNNPVREEHQDAIQPYGYQVHVYDQGRPENLQFLTRVRSLLDKYGATSLAEVGGTDPLVLMAQYTEQGRLHSAYSFALMRAAYGKDYVGNVISVLEDKILAPGRACYALSNHDKPRVATRWQLGRDQQETAKMHMAMLLAMRGDICIYQGEELGLPEADVPFEKLQDEYGRTFWPKFKGRDGCRTPMPWNDLPHAGFSTQEPWLPVDASHIPLNVHRQEQDATGMLAFTRSCIALRKSLKALQEGSIALQNAPDEILMFERIHEDQRLLCLFNLGTTPAWVFVPPGSRTLLSQHLVPASEGLGVGVSGFGILTLARPVETQ